MIGLYGIIGAPHKHKFSDLKKRLLRKSYQNHEYQTNEMSLGRSHLGIFFPNNQPVWDDSGKYGITIDGYIFSRDEDTLSTCSNQGHSILNHILILYKKKGDNFIHDIKGGVFNLIIIDFKAMKIKLFNSI